VVARDVRSDRVMSQSSPRPMVSVLGPTASAVLRLALLHDQHRAFTNLRHVFSPPFDKMSNLGHNSLP